jgi:ATP-dependent protease ClpP protease subunit
MKILQLLHDNAGREAQPLNLTRNANEATIYVYDAIFPEFGVNALGVIDALASLEGVETLNIRINSPGGDVFEGRAIMAALREFKGKTIAHVDSLCASAATSVALACDEVVMSDGAFFMIHNAHGMAYGDKSDLRSRADTMEKVEGAIVDDYTKKTGKPEEEVRALMQAETWFTAQEALDNGFVDSIAKTDKKTKNTWNLAAFSKPPEALALAKDAPPDPAPTEPEQKPAPAGFFMGAANANRLRLAQIV